MAVVDIDQPEQLTAVQSNPNEKNLIFFWAEWHEPSRRQGQMHSSFQALSEKYPTVKFVAIEAEKHAEISEHFGVTVVPTFFACVGTHLVEKLEGASPADLSALAKKLNATDIATTVFTNRLTSALVKSEEDQKKALHVRLGQLVGSAPVMLFMKGSPSAARCGFSRQIVEVLNLHQIPFASFDILTDDEVRAGLKEYSDWPTYPQLYVNGSLVGGLDIVKEMATAGDLKEQLGIQNLALPSPQASLQDRLKALVEKAPVMLFMKGSPAAARCGFSRQIVEVLNKSNITFDSFDILEDEDVRAGLKEYSDWPTYPQLYVNGSLVGGLDIVKEMDSSGNLKEQLGLI